MLGFLLCCSRLFYCVCFVFWGFSCASFAGVSPVLPLQPISSGSMIPTVFALKFGVPPVLPISISHSQRRIASFCRSSLWEPPPNIKLSSPPLPNIKLSSPLGIASKPFLLQNSWFHAIPILPNRRLLPSPPRASTNEHELVEHEHEPQGSSKREPRFWWRILACIPYLLCLLEIWFFAETARHIHPFLQDFKFYNCPFLRSLPRWFFFAFFAYLFVTVTVLGAVNRKEWPHFFRFHVDMSLLLQMLFVIAGILTKILTQIYSVGSLTQYLSQSVWVFISFAFVVVVLECMRCALCGMLPGLPFLSDVVEKDLSDRDAGRLNFLWKFET